MKKSTITRLALGILSLCVSARTYSNWVEGNPILPGDCKNYVLPHSTDYRCTD